MSLSQSAVRGVGATFLGQWGRLIVRIGSTMVLARLLTPEDYGLIGMVLVFTGFAERLKTIGLSTVTIQRKDIDQDQLTFLFWVNVALGCGIALLVSSVAPLITRFYGASELTGITIALSTMFIFGGVAAQHLALLNRRMDFKALAVIEISTMTIGALAAIVAAVLGAGYWSLVVFHATQPLVRGLLAIWRSGWKPSRPSGPRTVKDSRNMLSFGANLTGFELLNYLARNADNLLIGRFLGAASLGIYSKAYGLLLLPIQQIQGPAHRVAIPTLSRLQDDPDRFRRFFVTGLTATAFVVIPLLTFLAIAARPIILLLVGDQWEAAIPIFRILAIAGLAQALLHSNGWLYVSLGRVRRQMIWSIISTPIIVAGFVIGLRWGVEGVAWGYAIVVWLLLPPSFAYALRGTPVRPSDILRCGYHPTVLSLSGAIVALTVDYFTPTGLSVPVHAVVLTSTYLLPIALLLLLWPSGKKTALELMRIVRESYGQTT